MSKLDRTKSTTGIKINPLKDDSKISTSILANIFNSYIEKSPGTFIMLNTEILMIFQRKLKV